MDPIAGRFLPSRNVEWIGLAPRRSDWSAFDPGSYFGVLEKADEIINLCWACDILTMRIRGHYQEHKN